MDRLESKPLLSMNEVVDYKCYDEMCFGAEPDPGSGGGIVRGTIFWGSPVLWTIGDWMTLAICSKGSPSNGLITGLGCGGIAHSLINLTYACFQKYKPEKAGVGNLAYEFLETYRSPDSSIKAELTRKQLKAKKCCLDTTICCAVFTLALNITLMAVTLTSSCNE